jgi:hypothetical protein
MISYFILPCHSKEMKYDIIFHFSFPTVREMKMIWNSIFHLSFMVPPPQMIYGHHGSSSSFSARPGGPGRPPGAPGGVLVGAGENHRFALISRWFCSGFGRVSAGLLRSPPPLAPAARPPHLRNEDCVGGRGGGFLGALILPGSRRAGAPNPPGFSAQGGGIALILPGSRRAGAPNPPGFTAQGGGIALKHPGRRRAGPQTGPDFPRRAGALR